MFNDRLSYLSGVALAGAIALGGTRSVRAEDAAPTQPSQQQLLEKINALQDEVQQLKQVTQQQQKQQDATSRKVDESTAAALQQHADGSNPQGGFTAGYSDNRFTLQSPDKRFVLRPWLQLQTRYDATYRDDVQHGGKDPDTQTGFELRRLKFGFDGNAITQDFTYMFQFAVDRKSGTLSLEQAYGRYKIDGSPVYIKGGQFKEPLDHEQLLASRNLTAVDRTLTNDLFANAEGFVQGVATGYYDTDTPVRAELAFTDGQRSANTNFQDFSVGGNTADYGAAARAEYKVFGDWTDYDRSTGAYGTKSDFLVVGAGADYTEAGDTHTLTHIADVDYGLKNGVAFYGAYTGRAFSHAAIGSIGTNGGTTGKAVGTNGYDWSFRGQVSYAIDRHWEPYAQYEYIWLDQNNLPVGARNEIQVLRAGVNYYLLGTTARLSVDGNYLPGGSPISDDGIGILSTGKATKQTGFAHGGGNEFILRAQLQLNL